VTLPALMLTDLTSGPPPSERGLGERVRALENLIYLLQTALVYEIEQYTVLEVDIPEDLLMPLRVSERWCPLRKNLKQRLERAKAKEVKP